jgi:hypothetical protein
VDSIRATVGDTHTPRSPLASHATTWGRTERTGRLTAGAVMTKTDGRDPRGIGDVDERVEPSTRDLLLARVDELTARQVELLSEVKRVTEQLHPERARSCRNAITMASVMVDEIRLRAHARPLDDAGQ